MYDFHYIYIKRKYPDLTLLFTDTDSLMYQIQTVNVDEDFYADKQLFDFSGYEKESPFYNDETKKVIGKMKDELNGKTIEEFVGLMAKMYSLKTKKEGMKKAKEVKKNVVKKYIRLRDYVDCLFEERNICIPCRLYDHLNINSTPSNRIKSPLALTMMNDTCWMIGLALCHTAILVSCKYLGSLSIIFS